MDLSRALCCIIYLLGGGGCKMLRSANLWLVVTFLVYSIFIVIQSTLDPDGFLSSDSAHYLQMAVNLLDGDGMTTANYVSGMSTYFATWPVGYPVLIALTSFVTGTSVFWASKLVTIICLGFCFILIKRLFKSRAHIVAMLFFISTFTTLFVYTWSEVPFLLGMLWLVYGLVRYIETSKNRYAGHMMLAALFMFFMRYIGLIGAGIIGLIGFYYLFSKQWKKMLTCWIAGGIPILIAGIYLVINQLKTGHLTGMERIPRTETAAEFFDMLWDGVVAEFNLLAISHDYLLASITLLLIALILFVRPRHIKALFMINRSQFLLPGMFLFVGVVYFIAIVGMRWSAYFDPFNFRLLGPATFMFCLFFCGWVTQVKQRDWIRWRSFLVVVFGVAFLMNIVSSTYTLIISNTPDYQETVQQVEETYETIPSGSIVALENIHVRYIRPDLQFIKIHFKPYFAEKETLEDFVGRITPNEATGVYLQVHPLFDFRYHQSFVELMDEAVDQGKEFVKLND